MTTHAELIAITIDCAEPKKLAEFYSKITGWDVTYAEDAYAAVGNETTNIYFQQVPERKAAAWPGPDKQFHLDFRVPDVDKAVQEYIELGATKPDFQPGGHWTVMADPEGHLFCVCPERS
ncbi:VOC family protein [Sphaerisporangium fuscum]|uniref:VOC family protein n=1 Tax=Sphaerisporangium fuscum TaxID=2835868 RepID=UPI001BDDA1B7|nr:VOC family protein [Sphaerisporangium fuscum]